MLGIDARVRIDLESIIIMSGVFEEAIEGIKHFVGKKEEELSTTVLALVEGRQTSAETYLESPP